MLLEDLKVLERGFEKGPFGQLAGQLTIRPIWPTFHSLQLDLGHCGDFRIFLGSVYCSCVQKVNAYRQLAT
ncbi:hypothetical protein D3C81_1010410 [compost metagenome]